MLIIFSGVAILFLISWLPLSLFSLVVDVLYPPESIPKVSAETLYVVLAICHIIAMTSAISNPIVYGWLNSNIRNEFLHLFSSKCTSNPNQNNEDQTTTRTVLATSTQRKSGPITLHLKSERSERAPSPPDVHVESFML